LRHIILISGKDSLATAIVQTEAEPSLGYEFVFNETGWDLPETLDWIGRVESRLGKPILRLGDDLTEICYEENCLPLPTRRFCTRRAKIQPLNDYLGLSPATVYFGLRADEPDRVGYVVPAKQPLFPRYPLRDRGMGINEVWQICQQHDLMPPSFHWRWMEDRVRERLGCNQFMIDEMQPWERVAFFAWRSRSNCDRCFYARLYEKIGLLEHYPDRFEDACRLEESLCHRDEFSWAKGYRLRDLVPRAMEIKEARAKSISKAIHAKQQNHLWESEERDGLELTSCGLLCGK
jgi:hypothetical protein